MTISADSSAVSFTGLGLSSVESGVCVIQVIICRTCYSGFSTVGLRMFAVVDLLGFARCDGLRLPLRRSCTFIFLVEQLDISVSRLRGFQMPNVFLVLYIFSPCCFMQ